MATGEKKHLSADEEDRLRPFIDEDERRAFELRSYQAMREEKLAKSMGRKGIRTVVPPPILSENRGEDQTPPPEAA